ncbi:tRNA pseudouridine(38-40) synthase TruA [Sphingorhabdus contaminans]|uniref:tRNA pseudouridine(38-40) synthase TruA n=1 Tax=Sphingorhabdus contaminans TaxID=1343899 RepID=UPI003D286BDC
MTRFALTIEFDGSPYMGWQWQDHGPSVQGAIEEAIFKTTGEKTLVYSAGRTDAGVHALGMRAHVDIQKPLPPFRLMGAINAHLRPHPIAILACEEVDPEWHARYTCIGRSYEYRILNRRAPLTLEKGRVWRIGPDMDAAAMHDAAQLLVGQHDFTTFRSTACQSASPLKTLDRLDVRREGDHIIVEASALSFLHHQVRSMVGCLAAVGLGRWTAEDLQAALAARNRSALAENAPPEGLYFVSARYL